ncbi:hypothetical protein EDC04DRAFT_2895102 [Pisolithus marmoratus]|nr:hypothetical protein EDC04DRAFT_2895102 [Pisolithus marmoratus]
MSIASSVPFSALSINANGLGDPLKCRSISNMISCFTPTVWVISETKSPHPVASCIHISSYHKFESHGLPTSSHAGKWGVILGVSSAVYSQQVSLEAYPALQARAIAIDLVLPTPSGHSIPHCILGVYALWDSGIQADFWTQLAAICGSASQSWSVIGDANASIYSSEVSSPALNTPTSTAFQAFLAHTGGVDVWSSQGNNDVSSSFTFSNSIGCLIIDWVVWATLLVRVQGESGESCR